jgi:hypothetical protein
VVGGGGPLPEGVDDLLRNAIKISDDVIVPESENPKILMTQKFITRDIDALTGRSIMLAAVNFDDETRRIARKIHDKIINRDLPPEMKSFILQRTQEVPKLPLGVR